MNLTRLIYYLAFSRRATAIARYRHCTRQLQEEQFDYLTRRACHTAFGRQYNMDGMQPAAPDRQPQDFAARYARFADTIPLHTYDEMKPWIERMLGGERDVLWPGLCKWFAKSSGTTSDKSKYIPVTDDALHRTHYRGSTDSVVVYLTLNPQSRMFNGRALILGGSHKPVQMAHGLHAGDLSACLIQNINPLVNIVRTPSKRIALMDEWEEKLERITSVTQRQDVTNISGVPSWMLGVLRSVLRERNAKDLTEVWPHLEVFFHGGISFKPYREQYRRLIPSDKMHYVETYNASEGFFAVQSAWDDPSMQLVVDNAVFYEFIPMDDYDEEDKTKMQRAAVPLWEVELNRNYAMVITTPGLWRYIIGDTVRFTSRNPYKLVITGRTKSFINAFGEELMVSNADEALERVCKEMDCVIADYTAGPTFAGDSTQKSHHTWIIEFDRPPSNIEAFADRLDLTLQQLNSDYEAKRYKGIFLERLHLIAAPQGLFLAWLKAKGKLGGQHKIPRLSNSTQYIDELQKLAEMF